MTNNVIAISPRTINTKADAVIAIMIVIDPLLLLVFCITLSDDDNENEVLVIEAIGVAVNTEDMLLDLVAILVVLVLLAPLVAIGVAGDCDKEEEIVGNVESMEVD